ncbi:MAG TPA: hypothetical protein VII16_04400, partial [Actinomycetes bacterium]
HRIHWMAQQRPPVAADPHHPHKVLDWKVPLRVNGEPVTVKGELDWKGLPTLSTFVIALIALAGAVGVALAVAMAVALRRNTSQPESSTSRHRSATERSVGRARSERRPPGDDGSPLTATRAPAAPPDIRVLTRCRHE